MKTYIIYLDGVQWGTVKAGSHNAAEKKARAKVAKQFNGFRNVSVEYTEV